MTHPGRANTAFAQGVDSKKIMNMKNFAQDMVSAANKSHAQHQIKKMGMLRRQVWIADDEFDHTLENSQRVPGLSIQYENHPYVEEFTKQCNVMFVYGTYALEGEAGSKFSVSDI